MVLIYYMHLLLSVILAHLLERQWCIHESSYGHECSSVPQHPHDTHPLSRSSAAAGQEKVTTRQASEEHRCRIYKGYLRESNI